VAINTNAVTLGGSIPAKSSFRAQSTGSPANPVGAEPSSTADDSGNGTGSTPAAAATASGAAGAQKSTGPSAQTRGNSRARTNSAGPAGNPANTDTQPTPDPPSVDFVSAMADALGRSATTAPDLPGPTQAAAAADSGASTNRTSTSQPAPAAATDAVAWIAQVLAPATSAAQIATATATTSTGAIAVVADAKNAGRALDALQAGTRAASTAATAAANAAIHSGLPAEADSAATDPQATNGFAAQVAAQTALAAQSRARGITNPLPPSPAVPASDAQTAATATPSTTAVGNVNALADVQKLISGLTDATTTAADTEDSVATPQSHPAATGGSSQVGDAAAALQSAALSRSSSSLGNTTLTIHAPVGSPAFADEVTSQVTGLAQSGVTQAQLQLNPADMGPVQVHITLQAGQASVWFGATHADTRAALEQSLPRLRELFAGAGMPLTDSGVFREPPQQQQAPSLPAASSAASANADTVTAPTVTQVSNIRLSLLDTYA
jgi:flagellar hook-length control protein FliK